eukprot:TRINITY_DN17085_c0_g1_i1.p1 TRINITY_DN17085_c0_g1~~TRINITY_DN17085_c0_g1_i1.p1  ORF type:complete len:118 (-),score=13.19 TRINITY_DN17085_c0_g1_i1:165-497(-)
MNEKRKTKAQMGIQTSITTSLIKLFSSSSPLSSDFEKDMLKLLNSDVVNVKTFAQYLNQQRAQEMGLCLPEKRFDMLCHFMEGISPLHTKINSDMIFNSCTPHNYTKERN